MVTRLFTLPFLGAALALALNAAPVKAQIGSGWTEYHPSFSYNSGMPQSQRYSKSGTTEHFWLHSDDKDEFPGEDSGPRSEMRVRNDYTSGSQQFQATFRAEKNTNNVTVFQIFGAINKSTSIMLQMRSNNGTLKHYNDTIVATNCWTTYQRLNVIHYTSTGSIEVWINGSKKGTFNDGGHTNHYFKYGVYSTGSAAPYDGIYYQNARFFKK